MILPPMHFASGTRPDTNSSDVPLFNREALISALRTDQAGESTFPEFLASSWRAGVDRYDVDFTARTVAFGGPDESEWIVESANLERRAYKVVTAYTARAITRFGRWV
jgi:uncharacterized protein YbcV (DUF1398 family)